MSVDNANEGFEDLIQNVRKLISADDQELLDLFDMYAQEARFSRYVFDSDINKLTPGASILEVGAGMMMLSCQLKREGFNVTALEPFGEGFSHFTHLQNLVKTYAGAHGIEPEYLVITAEELDVVGEYDYAFSSNVMEHVGDIGLVLEKVHHALKPGSIYRFICPNYAFPYEPHFNMPTLGSKELTEKFLKKRIENNKDLPDPEGTWLSLNWITPVKVKRICKQKSGMIVRFNPSIFRKYLERGVSDPIFRQRRGKFLSDVLTFMSKAGVFGLTALIPTRWLPVMDCTLEKKT